MSRFSGPQTKGAVKRHRERLKEEAEARNELTPYQNRRANRCKECGAKPGEQHGCTTAERSKKKNKAVEISERGVK